MFGKIKRFFSGIFHAGVRTIRNFVIGVVRYTEAVTILVLATIGLAAILAEVIVFAMLPFFIATAMVIPVLAVLGILGLLKMAELRITRGWYIGGREIRQARHVAVIDVAATPVV